MTGPAVSQQLRRIEVEAGAAVVVPDGRGVRLTSQGRVLAGYAQQVAELMQKAENDLHREKPLVGHIRIAALASIIRTLLTTKLPDFLQTHPRVHVTVDDGETSDHLAELSQGRYDLVLAESWNWAPLELPHGVDARMIVRQPAYLALPAEHRLADRERVDLRDLADDQWVTCVQGSDPHSALVQAARQRGIEPQVSYHVTDAFSQLTLVQAGLAIACVPTSTETSEVSGIVWRPLDVAMHRDILMLRSNRTAPLAVEALADHVIV